MMKVSVVWGEGGVGETSYTGLKEQLESYVNVHCFDWGKALKGICKCQNISSYILLTMGRLLSVNYTSIKFLEIKQLIHCQLKSL